MESWWMLVVALDEWSFCEDYCMWNPSTCDCYCNTAGKIAEYLDIKSCSCKNCLFGKLILVCEDESYSIMPLSGQFQACLASKH